VNNVKKIVAVLGAGLLILVTGCSSSNSAATVGKTEIPLKTLQGTVSEIIEERNKVETTGLTLATGAELNVNAVRFHVISVLFDDIAERIKVKITDAEIAARRADIVLQVGGEDRIAFSLVGAQIAPRDFERYIRTVLLAEKLGEALKANGDTSTDGSGIQKLIVGMGKEEKVTINPRYGVWNYETGNVDPVVDNAAVKK
jgi:SurA N-terminal domain